MQDNNCMHTSSNKNTEPVAAANATTQDESVKKPVAGIRQKKSNQHSLPYLANQQSSNLRQQQAVQLPAWQGATKHVPAQFEAVGISVQPQQQHGDASSENSVIQREVTAKFNVEDGYKDAYNNFLGELDKAVMKAYFYALHYPTLKGYANLDGHTEHWIECWKGYRNGTFKNLSLLKAAFGYAVETLATVIYLPQPGGELTVELQGTRGKTRPDIVLKHGKTDVGWLDITAFDSKGHIWKKANWLTKQIHLSEVAYPSLDPAVIIENVHNDRQFDDKTDAKEMLARVNYYKFMQNIRRKHWQQIGLSYFGDPLESSNNKHKRAYIRKRVAEYLNAPIGMLPPNVLGSVLYAMGQGYTKHGYKKLSVSRALGESILQQHDRELPGIESYSPELAYQITTNEDKAAREILSQLYAESGKHAAITSTDDLDEIVRTTESQELTLFQPEEQSALISLGTESGNQILEVGKRLSGFMRQTISLDFSSLSKLYFSLSKEMKKSSLINISVAIRLKDGNIIGGRLDETGIIRIASKHSFEKRMEKLRKEKKEKLLWEKRNQITSSNFESGDSIPRSLSIIQNGPISLSSDLLEYIQELGEGEIIGFAYTGAEGEEVIIGEDNSNLL
jgi:hypothetical protein